MICRKDWENGFLQWKSGWRLKDVFLGERKRSSGEFSVCGEREQVSGGVGLVFWSESGIAVKSLDSVAVENLLVCSSFYGWDRRRPFGFGAGTCELREAVQQQQLPSSNWLCEDVNYNAVDGEEQSRAELASY